MSTKVKVKEELKVAEEEKIKEDLGLIDEVGIDDVDADLEKKADDVIDNLLNPETDQNAKRAAVDNMGMETQREVARLSKMLDGPIKALAKTGENGGPVAKALLDLKEEVEELDPAKFDFSSASGFLNSLARFLPWGAKPISRYFAKYMSAEDVIERIIDSLRTGREQLKRDNITLGQDKDRMIKAMGRLKKAIQLAKLMDEKLQYKIDREISPDDPQYNFVKEELLFPLRQRIMDLQQTLNVNQQGVLTIEVIIRNNRELVRGVDRALNVTVTALQIAVACALALNNQEIVLGKVKALNETTSKLIAHNAKRLKTQGVEIHKQAAQATLKMEDLEKAFADINSAIENISKFRQESLPKMAQSISRMSELNKAAGTKVDKMEKGNAADASIQIDV